MTVFRSRQMHKRDNDPIRTAQTTIVDLGALHLRVGRVRFTDAEMPQHRSPFALVHYLLDDAPQSLAHRLDLDKRIFLDSLESGSQEDARRAAGTISDYLVELGGETSRPA